MAGSLGRFVVEDGEIIDTRNREIISREQLAKVATPAEQAQMDEEIAASGWGGADQSLEAQDVARSSSPKTPQVAPDISNGPLPANPSLNEFMQVAKADNPGVPDSALRKYWAQKYGKINPKTLPSLEAFMPAAREDNPDLPDDVLRAHWQERYGDLGASETEPKVGLGGTIIEGVKSAGRSLKAAGQALIGDSSGVVDTAKAQQAAEKDPALERLLADIQQRKEALGKDPSFLATAGELGKAVLGNPKGAGLLLAEQLPNSAVAMGSALAGAAAGSFLGPVGTVAGGLAGLFGANTALETGGKAIEAGADQTFTPEDRSRVLREGLTKGSVITALDAASLGLTNWITGTTARAVERATAKALTDAGVDVADKAAVMAARSNPEIVAAVQLAQKNATAAVNTLGQKLSRGSGALGVESIGEGAGEYLGEYAATGDPDKMEALIEAFAGLGQSAGEIATTQALNRKRGDAALLPSPENTTPAIPSVPTPITAVPEKLGVGDPSVGIDESIKTAWELLNEDTDAQERNAIAAQRQAERQLLQGPSQALEIPRTGTDIPILQGPDARATTLPIADPSRLWMDEAVVPGIEPGQAFTPRTSPEPNALEQMRTERRGLIWDAMQNPGAQPQEMIPKTDSGSSTEPAPDVPLQSASDLAYPPSERNKVPSQQDLLLRQNREQPRSGYEVPTLPAAQQVDAQGIVPGSAFTPRADRELTPKERISQERAKILAMKATQPPKPPTTNDVLKSEELVDRVLPSAIDRAYPSVAKLHALAKDKGFDVDSQVFKTLTKMVTGKEHLDSLSPGERDRFAEKLGRMEARKTPEVVAPATQSALKPAKPIEPSNDAVTAPRSALPPEKNAEMLLRAEKAKADLEIDQSLPDVPLIQFLKDKGGVQDQGGELSTMEVDGERAPFSKNLINPKGLTLDDAAEIAHEAGYIQDRDISLLLQSIDRETRGQGGKADWYQELTTGPKPLSRQAIDTAIEKIIKDHGLDTGKAVERVKAALLNDGEFDGSQWGEDAAAVLRGDWPSWIPKPEAPPQSGSVQTSEPVSASPPTEGTTTIAPSTEAATRADLEATTSKGSTDSIVRHAESLRDLTESEPFKSQGFGGLNVPSRRGVLADVFWTGQDLKIREAIIRLLPVNVVNYLRLKKLTPEMLFDDKAVLLNSFPSNARNDIALGAKEADSLIRSAALVAAKSLGIGPLFPSKDLPAVGASDINATRDSSGKSVEAGSTAELSDAGAPSGELDAAPDAGNGAQVAHDGTIVPRMGRHGQTEIEVPREVIGSRPIIGREVTPEEAPLFSEAAKQPDAEQLDIAQGQEEVAPKAAPEMAPSPTEILASALRTAADQIEGKPNSSEKGLLNQQRTMSASPAQPIGSMLSHSQNPFADPSQEEAETVQSAIEGKTPLEAATFIAQNAPSEDYRLIAGRVAEQLQALQAAGMDFSLHIAHLNDRVPSALIGTKGMSWLPERSMKTQVWLQGADVQTLVGTSYETVLHELIHATTQATIYMAEQPDFENSELANTVQDLRKVANAAKAHFVKRLEQANGDLSKLLPIERAIAQSEDNPLNPLNDIGEVLAWTFTNREMQRYMETIPYRTNTSLWDAFVQGIRRFLGLTPTADTALSEVLRVGEKLMTVHPGQLMTSFRDAWMPRQINQYAGLLNAQQATQATTPTDDIGLTYQTLNDPSFTGLPAVQQQAALDYHLPAMSKMDDVVRTLQDKNIDLVRLVESIKAAGKTISDDVNPVLKEELYMGRVSKLNEDFLTGELRPLVDAMRLNKVTMPQLDEYLHARHAKEANAHLKEINPDREDNEALSGMTDAEADRILAAADKPKMDRLAAKVDAILAKSRSLLVEYGLEKPETVEQWAADYQYYVPLHRAGYEDGTPGTGQGRSVRGPHSKARTGSTLAVTNILANVALDREKVITRGEKMRPVIALAGLLQQFPNKEVARLVKPRPMTYTNPDTGLQETAPGDIGDYRVPRIKGINKKTGKVEWRPDPLYKGRENVVNFRLHGEDHAIVFNEDNERSMKMARALKDLEVGQLNGVLSTIAPVTRYFSAISTQYNPVFGVVNLIRDAQFAMLSLSSTPLAKSKGKVLASTWKTLRGIYQDARAVRAGKDPSSATAALWERFQKVGGPTGYKEMFRGSNDRAKAIEHMLDPDWWTKTLTGKILTANGHLSGMQTLILDKAAKPLFNWLSDYNQAMENSVRLAAFKVATEQGMSDEQAARLAKNLTVNFNKKGTVTTQMGAMYAFFNASVQGTARIAESLFEKGQFGVLSATGKKIVAGGIALGSMQAIGLLLAGFDDDQPPEFVRSRNLIIPVPGTEKGYVTTPMPLGFNILPNFGRLVTEAIIHGKPMDRAWTFASSLVDTFSPVGGAGSVSQFLAPTVADPLVALSENKDWAGRKISKEDLNSLKPTPGHTRAKDSSTPWARGLSEAINYATGGSAYTPGKLSPTPDSIDYLIGSLTGGVGREVAHMAQTAGGMASGEDVPLYKVPLVGRFVGDASGSSAMKGTFYDNLKEVNEAYAELKGRRLAGEDTSEYRMEHPEAALESVAHKLEHRISELNKKKRRLISEGASRDQVKLIEQTIEGTMRRFNDRVRELQAR